MVCEKKVEKIAVCTRYKPSSQVDGAMKMFRFIAGISVSLTLCLRSAYALTPEGLRAAKGVSAAPRRPTPNAPLDTRRAVDVLGVIDFECTCEDSWSYIHELIEFPVVLVDCRTREIIGEFQSYVKPTENQTLSEFCTKLTGIEQETVDLSPELPEVLAQVDEFLRSYNLIDSNISFALATDGWDLHHFLDTECARKTIPKADYLNEWIDLTKTFDERRSQILRKKKPAYARRTNMGKMLRHYGMSFEGRKHSGIDDARNLARLAIRLLKEGLVLRVNDKLEDYQLQQ